jgi:hypothetical protein
MLLKAGKIICPPTVTPTAPTLLVNTSIVKRICWYYLSELFRVSMYDRFVLVMIVLVRQIISLNSNEVWCISLAEV